MEFWSHSHDVSIVGSTLVIPAVTVASLGQLALDVLIETQQADKIGNLHHTALLPCAGSKSFDHVKDAGPALAMEVYRSGDLVLLQQRAPVAAGCQSNFAQSIASWAQEQGVAQVWDNGAQVGIWGQLTCALQPCSLHPLQACTPFWCFPSMH